MKVYTEDDASPELVKSAPVAVIGYGSQGRAHALNLRIGIAIANLFGAHG